MDFWIFGVLDFWNFWIFGFLDFGFLGFLDFLILGFCDSRVVLILEFWSLRVFDVCSVFCCFVCCFVVIGFWYTFVVLQYFLGGSED